MGLRSASIVGIISLLVGLGCSGEAGPGEGAGGAGAGSSGPSSGSGAAGMTTWWEDVAPIVYDNCIGCHQEGGIAPMPLLTYDNARAVAGVMKAETAERLMPPWHADNSGDCATYADARWLSDEQIATIGAWADDGAPEGDPANAPPLPGAAAGLDDVTATLDMGDDYEPNGDIDDDYRCFIVDPQTSEDMYLTDYEVKPGDPRVVHHVILYSLDSAQAETEAEDADAADPGLGYTCFGGAGSGGATFIAGWAPGTAVTHYPEGTGVLMHGGRRAVMQVHYNTTNGSFTDRTTIDITLVPSVPRPATITPVGVTNLVLPPGQERIEASDTMVNPAPIPVLIHGSYPHMHGIGTDLRVDIAGSSGDKCAMWVPHWDFNWQQFYFYEDPIVALPADLVTITCAYDTRGRTGTTTFGEGTQDEMCFNFVYVTQP